MERKATIIGCGLVGPLLGIFLAKHGYSVSIFEQRPEPKTQLTNQTRSINLALSDRGIKALKEAGILESIMKIALPMFGRSIHQNNGEITFQPYGTTEQCIYSVSRAELSLILLELARERGIKIYFDYKCSSIDFVNGIAHFGSPGKENQTEKSDIIFGADGANSHTRLLFQNYNRKINFSQQFIEYGYKEILIPAGKNSSALFSKDTLHIWPRKEFMMIALPNQENTFTGTLFLPFEGPVSFQHLTSKQNVVEFFSTYFTDAAAVIPDIFSQFENKPAYPLVTIKCFPWRQSNKFCLIGDAAHAILPFFGQGMNAGFEDCSVLNLLIEEHNHNWDKILSEFELIRKQDNDAIADLAQTNFTEMKEKTSDNRFLIQKKLEAKLHNHHPDKWIPSYTQVTFSPHIRYSEALLSSRRQEAIIQEVMLRDNIEEIWNENHIEELIISKL